MSFDRHAALRFGAWLAFGTAVAVLIGWNADLQTPQSGADRSSHAALYMAAHLGLGFGDELVWTYGPLGFLKFPVGYYVDLAAISVVYVAGAQLLTAALFVLAGRRALGMWVPAIVLAAMGMWALSQPRIWDLGYAAPVTVLVFCLCAAIVRTPMSRRWRLAAAAGAGLWTAIEVLSKISVGGVALLMFVVAFAVTDRDRVVCVVVYGLSALVSMTALWSVIGQDFAKIDDYLESSVEIVSGYGAQGDDLGVGLLALTAAGAAGVGVSAWVSTRTDSVRSRVGVALLTVLFVFGSFKAAFVAGGGTHVYIFFTSMVGAWFAFPWREGRVVPAALFGLVALVYAVSLAAQFGGQGAGPLSRNILDNRPTAIVQRLRERLDSDAPARAAAELRREYRVPTGLVEAARDRPIHVGPGEATVAWAYGLHWRPLPVFQDHTAYTPRLDRMNARALRGPGGPDRIIRRPTNRLSPVTGTETTLTLLCRFRPVLEDGGWQLVRRVPDRCGRLHRIGRTTVRDGDGLRVPDRPRSVVTARIRGLDPNVGQRIRSFVFRPPHHSVTVGNINRGLISRNVADTGMLVHAPEDFDFSGVYALSPDVTHIAIDPGMQRGRRVTVDFYAVPVASSASR